MTLEIRNGSKIRPRTTVDCVSRCISTAIATARMVWNTMLKTTYSTVTSERVPEQRVLEELGEVVQADEGRRPEQVVPGQAEVEAADEGVEVEHQEADQCRQDEKISAIPISLRPGGLSVPRTSPGLKSAATIGSTVSAETWSCACSLNTRSLGSSGRRHPVRGHCQFLSGSNPLATATPGVPCKQLRWAQAVALALDATGALGAKLHL